MKILITIIQYVLSAGLVCGAVEWDMEKLEKPPVTYNADQFAKEGVTTVFFEGVPWKQNPTRVFAYYGFPEMKKGGKVPAMVLVHGGGGSAFPEWVRLWNSRGYAAIAMDTCGAIPGGPSNDHKRHEFSGPPGWGGFDQTDLAEHDQWTYHAVAAVVGAHSLLRTFPEVDPERIGITGVSWGGYLTSITAGVDHRFKFAAPVYGCGFITENSCWLEEFKKMGPEKTKQWAARWDPSSYLPQADLPLLWTTGTNDFAYPLDSLQKSYLAVKGMVHLSIPGDMPHGQEEGASAEVIHAFADQVLKKGIPLPVISPQQVAGGTTSSKFKSDTPIEKAELLYTSDTGNWKERKWNSKEAGVDNEASKVSAEIPPEAKVFYLNIHDRRGFAMSSRHIEVK
ncbi:MAG: acetylxylan esterase [Armatimonadetes bacterium]|nr:acetylxylan esterase [Akkermansiaceae bacterium]